VICQNEGEANLTLARPVIQSNRMIEWYEVDVNPYDGVGVSEKAIRYLRAAWSWSKTYTGTGGVLIDSLHVLDDIKTIPLLAASAIVLPLMLSDPSTSLPVAAIAGATVAMGPLAYLGCYIGAKADYYYSTYIYANYFYSPTPYKYHGDDYYIGSLYVDALII